MPRTYELHIESGPKHKKTMTHVFDLLGCVNVGPTTEEAVATTPDAMRAFKRFLQRHGEATDPDEPFELMIAQHITEGEWLGNGSPYITFNADLLPLSDAEVDRYVARIRWLDDELAAWAEGQEPAALAAKPDAGRAPREILLHVLGAHGPYLSAALGSAPGFGRIHGAAERGELPLPEAFQRAAELVEARVAETTPEQRNTVRELSSRTYTLRKALRRGLEHGWEHYAELSRRPGGPTL